MHTCGCRHLSPACHLCNVGSFLPPDMNNLKLIVVPTDFRAVGDRSARGRARGASVRRTNRGAQVFKTPDETTEPFS